MHTCNCHGLFIRSMDTENRFEFFLALSFASKNSFRLLVHASILKNRQELKSFLPSIPSLSWRRSGSRFLVVFNSKGQSSGPSQGSGLTLTLFHSFPKRSVVTPSISNCLYINRIPIDFYDSLSQLSAT